MAIYGVGAFYGEDVSSEFIEAGIAGIGWSSTDAPDLHQFMRSLKVGDIVYIKSQRPGSDLSVKAIGLITTDEVPDLPELAKCARKVRWISTETFTVPVSPQKNNVRNNTLYEEFHPNVQMAILDRIQGREPRSPRPPR
jgi:hypothetical protein